MKKIILIIATLTSQKVNSQILLGINASYGNSKGVSVNNYKENISSGPAWDAAINIHFNSSKRFNPKLNLGFTQKSYTDIFKLSYFGTTNPITIVTEDLITTNKISGLYLDLGVRYNVLNKTHKVFIDLVMCNNFILQIQNKRNATNFTGDAKAYNTNPTNPYYVSVAFSIGYTYNNMFSISPFANIGLTNFDSHYNLSVNMYGINLCYYLPILGNKKVKTVTAVVAP